MATKKEITELLVFINSKYSTNFPDIGEMLVSVWQNALASFPKEIISAAFDLYQKEKPDVAPGPAEIAKKSDDLLDRLTPAHCLKRLQENLQRYGVDVSNWPKDTDEILLRVAEDFGGLKAINEFDSKTAEFRRFEMDRRYKEFHSLAQAGLLSTFKEKNLLGSGVKEPERKYFMTNAEAVSFAIEKAKTLGSGLSAKDWHEMGIFGVTDPEEWKKRGYAASPIYKKPSAITEEDKKRWDEAKARVDEEFKKEMPHHIINYTKLYGGNPLKVLQGKELEDFKIKRRQEILANYERNKKDVK